MSIPDLINAFFEVGGIIACSLHIKTIRKEKKVNGLSLPGVAHFSAWGYWNIYYYSHLGQYASLIAGMILATTNSIWLYYLYKYRNN